MDLAIAGELLTDAGARQEAKVALKPRPKALAGACPECGEILETVAQFWPHGRLWSLGFCT